ncbi:MAG: signal peptide peptidase SppA [Deltaproteobacteria bacterium]|nr:MAG: signal peptide peptidase SppA [Deltaproteobacteria bacterium]
MRTYFFIIFTVMLLVVSGCISPQFKLFSDSTDPLEEFTLEGEKKGKVLLVSVKGVISDAAEKGMFGSSPSVVQAVVSQLRKAEEDDEIRAVLLKIDSPGGTVTASDILYHEIAAFKKRTGVKVVVAMMSLAASGGYYISLPADFIMAHPTTVSGSVGVIFMQPKVSGLMDKIGLRVEVSKSGKNKDMASPFRQATEEEQEILQGLVDQLAEKFIKLVAKHRNLDRKTLTDISSGRIYLAGEAEQMGLIDQVGYLSDAILKAKSLAGLSEDAKVVVYRRTEYPEDNLYNTSAMKSRGNSFSLINMRFPRDINSLHTGFCYLWRPAGN